MVVLFWSLGDYGMAWDEGFTVEYLHRWGRLRPSPLPDRAHPPRWYVARNRPGLLRTYGNCALAARLMTTTRPAFAVTLPEAPGVPLVAVFAIEDAADAERRMGSAEGSGTEVGP